TTFKGEVQFEGAEGYPGKALRIKAGQQAQFVVPSTPSVFTPEELKSFLAQGYMTSVYGLSAKALEELDKSNQWGSAPALKAGAEKSAHICEAPKGSFNDCQWSCKNNPKKSKTCRASLPQVQCL